MQILECENCCYFWKEDDDSYITCHYEGDPYYAPCEEQSRIHESQEIW